MHEEGGISPEDEEEEVVVVGLTSLLPSVDEKVLVEAVAENDELAAKAASEQDKLDEVKQEDKIDLDENGTRKRKRQKKEKEKLKKEEVKCISHFVLFADQHLFPSWRASARYFFEAFQK